MTSIAPGPASPARPVPDPGVIAAGPADADTLSDLIAEAFLYLPPSRWLIGDPAARRATKRTRRLYARHGYRLCPGAPIQLPGDGPLMWPMWRESYQHPLKQPVLP